MLVQAAPSDNRRNRIYETRHDHSWVQCEADGGIAPARERVCWKGDNSSLSAKWLPDPWELVCVFFRWPGPRTGCHRRIRRPMQVDPSNAPIKGHRKNKQTSSHG